MLAIIPARAGSKRLPGKNAMLLNGKPMIAYSIELALAFKEVSQVIVSTDSEQIADIAKDYGIRVDELRPAHLSTDEAKSIEVFQYHIESLEMTGITHRTTLILQPTSPLRQLVDLVAAHDLMKKFNANSVISYTKELHPVSWHRYISQDLKPEEVFHPNQNPMPKTFYPNGAIYFVKTELIKMGRLEDDTTKAYIMPRERSVDIDTMEDFRFAEFLLERGYASSNNTSL